MDRERLGLWREISGGSAESSDCELSRMAHRRGTRSPKNVGGGGASFVHGQPFTVSGSGFGSKSPAAPIKYDDFQSVSVGSEIINSTASGPAWANGASNNTNPIASTAQLRSGTPFTRNMRSRWDGNPGGSSSIDSSNVTFTQTFAIGLIHAHVYLDDQQGFSGLQNIKIFRWHKNDGDGAPNAAMATPGVPDVTTDTWAYQVDGATNPNWFDTDIGYTLGHRWLQVTFGFDLGTGNGNADGSGFCRIDGQLVKSFTNTAISDAGTTSLDLFYVGNYAGNVAWTGVYQQFWESVYVDNTWARVELGNASTYGACTNLEIQIPTSWSSSSITFTANRGSFGVGATTRYLYVTDSSNTTQMVQTVTVDG